MIQILLVEDQEIVRRGLKTLLEIKPDLRVVREAGNGQVALEQLESLHAIDQPPDVVLVDIRMPIMDGVTATQRMCQKFPGTKVLVLSTFDDAKYVAKTLQFGAKGYLLKDTPAQELAESIRLIHKGYTQFGPGILEKMIDKMPSPQPEQEELPPGMAELTSREREVLLMIAKGSSNREIAQTLFLSEGTVRNHISRILARLNLRDRTQAALVANAYLSWLETPDTPRTPVHTKLRSNIADRKDKEDKEDRGDKGEKVLCTLAKRLRRSNATSYQSQCAG